MTTHEGVSCDSCQRQNFRGRRFKCLVCYDYDLCSACYERGAIGNNHSTEHAMQCIMTRADIEFYYGGEGGITDRIQSFTCPYCARPGFSEAALQEHLSASHPDATQEMICPVCAATPSGEPNRMTDHLASHLAHEHGRGNPAGAAAAAGLNDLARDAPVRRPLTQGGRGGGFAGRARRSNGPPGGGGGADAPPSAASYIRAERESMDPIAELLSQLGGIRRAGAGVAGGGLSAVSSHLQQFQHQAARHAPQRRLVTLESVQAAAAAAAAAGGALDGAATAFITAEQLAAMQAAHAAASVGTASSATAQAATALSQTSSDAENGRFLMPTLLVEPARESDALLTDAANRSLFVQDLLLATLAERALGLSGSDDEATASTLELGGDSVRSRFEAVALPVLNHGDDDERGEASDENRAPTGGRPRPQQARAPARPPRVPLHEQQQMAAVDDGNGRAPLGVGQHIVDLSVPPPPMPDASD